MQKIWKIFEYGYLIIAVVFIIETFRNWGTQKSYLLLLFSVLAIFMYFFRKRFRKKFENRNKK